MLLHFDGEFATVEDLVIDTLTGRNFGWLPTEAPTAVDAHRQGDPRGRRRQPATPQASLRRAGVPYRAALARHRSQPAADVQDSRGSTGSTSMKASDEQILLAVAKLMHAYIDSLRFGTKNTRPRGGRRPTISSSRRTTYRARPDEGESDLAYAQAPAADHRAARALRTG